MKFLLAIAIALSVGYMTFHSEKKEKNLTKSEIINQKLQDKILKQRSQNFRHSQVTSYENEVANDKNDDSLDFPTIGDSIYNNIQYETDTQIERDRLIGDINQQMEENKRIVDQENSYENHVEQAEVQGMMISRAAEEAIAENEVRGQPWNDFENGNETEPQFNPNTFSRRPAVIGEPEFDDEVGQVRENAQENGFEF